ncbi:MAG: hypothetical protein HFI71_14445 [Lachnospiraceae bacterium]|nr:hypothetical protein [Lachnospiraceae bacterium]
MKHGRNPTRKQKIFIKKFNLNPENWLIVKDCKDCFEIVDRLTGNRRILKRTNAREV